LAAAFDAGLHAILCITKVDLADPTESLKNFENMNVEVVLNRSDEPSLEKLHELLLGHTTVAVGHSGVGKSTLVNAVAPNAGRATGHVNAVTGRGRQTSTSVRAIALEHGWIIDTPGVRSFGLGHIKLENLLKSFGDLYEVIETCPRDCSHTADAPDCALDEAIAENKLGETGETRVDSLRRIMKSLDSSGDVEPRPARTN
jgi:ribosome biogenesis GTPase